MTDKPTKIERLSARLDVNSQKKVTYLLELGYGPTDLVREGIDLMYNQALNSKLPSIPALLKSLSLSEGEGPADLSSKRKNYYKDKLVEKYTR